MLTQAGHSGVQVLLSPCRTATDETNVVPVSFRYCPVKGATEMVLSVHSEMSRMGWREAREFKVQNLPLRWLQPNIPCLESGQHARAKAARDSLRKGV